MLSARLPVNSRLASNVGFQWPGGQRPSPCAVRLGCAHPQHSRSALILDALTTGSYEKLHRDAKANANILS